MPLYYSSATKTGSRMPLNRRDALRKNGSRKVLSLLQAQESQDFHTAQDRADSRAVGDARRLHRSLCSKNVRLGREERRSTQESQSRPTKPTRSDLLAW